MKWRPSRRDLLFIIDTLMPQVQDRERTADQLYAEPDRLDHLLDDERLVTRLLATDETLIHVSPRLLFTIVLRRIRRDLEQQRFTVERRHRQWVLLFDTPQVVELLSHEPTCDYLASMLHSFTRINDVTGRVQVREGVWRWFRTNELDVEGMMRYSQTLDESLRFGTYKRIADACLFLTGMFPEYIDAQYRYPQSQQVRPRIRGQVCVTLEDYEAHGRAFYQLAADHPAAQAHGLQDVLASLADNFVLAEKPLTIMANRYLQLARHKLFGI